MTPGTIVIGHLQCTLTVTIINERAKVSLLCSPFPGARATRNKHPHAPLVFGNTILAQYNPSTADSIKTGRTNQHCSRFLQHVHAQALHHLHTHNVWKAKETKTKQHTCAHM